MTSISVVCPACGRRYRSPAEHAGRTGHCKKCGVEFVAAAGTANMVMASVVPTTTSTLAMLSLLLGLASPCLSYISGIPAIVIGCCALYQIRQQPNRLRGSELAWGGIAIGLCVMLLAAVVLGFGLIMATQMGSMHRQHRDIAEHQTSRSDSFESKIADCRRRQQAISKMITSLEESRKRLAAEIQLRVLDSRDLDASMTKARTLVVELVAIDRQLADLQAQRQRFGEVVDRAASVGRRADRQREIDEVRRQERDIDVLLETTLQVESHLRDTGSGAAGELEVREKLAELIGASPVKCGKHGR